MKISVITGPFMCLPPYSIGAVEKLWACCGNIWIERGDDVTFICKKPDNMVEDSQHKYIRGYERTGSWVKDFILDFIYSWKALIALDDTDILILNSQWSPILIRFFRKKYKKSIYSVERFPKRQMGFYRKIGKVDYFRCCSTAVFEALIRQNPELKDCSFIVPNFIDTTVFSGDACTLNSDKTTVVYAGRIHAEKGLDILIKALERVNNFNERNVKLMLIGPWDKAKGGGGSQYKEELKKLAQKTEIEWVDPIYEPAKLATVMQRGDIFCYPSTAAKGEALSVAPLEALGLGLPTIVSNLDCFKDYIEHGQNGLIFDYKNSNADILLANQIEKLISDENLYKKLSLAGTETAKLFSANIISNNYKTKFEELLNG